MSRSRTVRTAGVASESSAAPNAIDWMAGLVGSLALFLCVSGQARAEVLPDVSAHPPWTLAERNEDPDGYVLYRRQMADSDFAAFRLEATIEAAPASVADAFRKNVLDPSVSPKNMKKTVLDVGDDGLLVYSYIEMPLVSDRDVTTRGVRSFDATTGSHRFDWNAVDAGPPPKDGVVRLQKSSGSWVFTPLPGERTFAVYENHTEIEGSIPAWVVTGFMSDSVVEGLSMLRARVEHDRNQMASESGDRSGSAR